MALGRHTRDLTDGVRHPVGHPHAVADRHSFSDRDSDHHTVAFPVGDGHRDSVPVCGTGRDRCAYRDSDRDTEPHPDRDTDDHRVRDANPDADTHPNPHTDAHSHTDANPDGVRLGDGLRDTEPAFVR